MIITTVVLVSVFFSLGIGLLIGSVKKLGYFKGAIETYRSVRIPDTPRSKGDVRRIRKYRLMVKTARRRMLALFLTQFTIFVSMYVVMLYVVMLTASRAGAEWVKIPVAIPLLSIPSEEGGFTTHISFISILAFTLPLHFVNKRIRLSSEEAVA